MKVIKMKRQDEMVTFEVLVHQVRLLAVATFDGADYFKRCCFKSRLMTLSAYFMGFTPKAEERYEYDPYGKQKFTISEGAFRLMLRAIRQKITDSNSLVFANMWATLYYAIRSQVDRRIWKRCERLSYGTK